MRRGEGRGEESKWERGEAWRGDGGVYRSQTSLPLGGKHHQLGAVRCGAVWCGVVLPHRGAGPPQRAELAVVGWDGGWWDGVWWREVLAAGRAHLVGWWGTLLAVVGDGAATDRLWLSTALLLL